MQFVDEAVGKGLFARQAGGTGADGLNAAEADNAAAANSAITSAKPATSTRTMLPCVICRECIATSL